MLGERISFDVQQLMCSISSFTNFTALTVFAHHFILNFVLKSVGSAKVNIILTYNFEPCEEMSPADIGPNIIDEFAGNVVQGFASQSIIGYFHHDKRTRHYFSVVDHEAGG